MSLERRVSLIRYKRIQTFVSDDFRHSMVGKDGLVFAEFSLVSRELENKMGNRCRSFAVLCRLVCQRDKRSGEK